MMLEGKKSVGSIRGMVEIVVQVCSILLVRLLSSVFGVSIPFGDVHWLYP
jgi:hypothetical protein